LPMINTSEPDMPESGRQETLVPAAYTAGWTIAQNTGDMSSITAINICIIVMVLCPGPVIPGFLGLSNIRMLIQLIVFQCKNQRL
jgi:hypothetical protein